MKGFGKKDWTLLWQLEFEEWKITRTRSFSCKNYIIRILIFCSLRTCLQFFLTQGCVFYRKKRLIFTYYNVKMHPFPFKSHIFSEMFVSKKNADTSLQKRACRVRLAKTWFKPYFFLYTFTLQSFYILSKTDSEKKWF